MNSQQKRVMAVHDISCVGKCSLTVALPIISAAGIETSALPTAVLSTHTGGFKDFTYRDLTDDILPICNHWKSLDLKFDSIYTGFLGSFEQLEIVDKIFSMFGNGALKLVDPVMADNGKLYSVFDETFPIGMKKLCKKADIIIPNITEACLMLGIEYKAPPYNTEYVETILHGLKGLGVEKIVLTGVSFENGKLGVAVCSNNEQTRYYFSSVVPGSYHGTGDVFGSALLAAMLNNKTLYDSARIAVDFTVACIRKTFDSKTDVRYGVNFESQIPELLKNIC